MKRGFDSVAASAAEWRQIVPPNPEVIGSYANGRYANTTSARQAFPHAIHYEYDVSGGRSDADVLDVEPQDAVPAQAHGWSRQHNATGGPHVLPHPGLYCSASTSSQVISDMLDAGFKRNEFLLLSAHYGAGEHICGPGTCHYPQADGTQWDDHGAHGQNTDRLIYGDHFFGPPPPPPDPDARYNLFDGKFHWIWGFRVNERATVVEYDKWRSTQTHLQHPHRVRLALLRMRCKILAGRIDRLGHPERFYRRWRARELRDRAAGKRLV